MRFDSALIGLWPWLAVVTIGPMHRSSCRHCGSGFTKQLHSVTDHVVSAKIRARCNNMKTSSSCRCTTMVNKYSVLSQGCYMC